MVTEYLSVCIHAGCDCLHVGFLSFFFFFLNFLYSFYVSFYSCLHQGVLLSQVSVAQCQDKLRVQKTGVYVEEKQGKSAENTH